MKSKIHYNSAQRRGMLVPGTGNMCTTGVELAVHTLAYAQSFFTHTYSHLVPGIIAARRRPGRIPSSLDLNRVHSMSRHNSGAKNGGGGGGVVMVAQRSGFRTKNEQATSKTTSRCRARSSSGKHRGEHRGDGVMDQDKKRMSVAGGMW